ncbi:GNAT family N-acetyltransferase [Roseivirga sp. BDSF3-8]|uniref:GNAT family N-acetyltransferase n=1 Tax=Roseivirga sp. BDSF3-8 TaxID=3241598 RepID=UPI00353266CE
MDLKKLFSKIPTLHTDRLTLREVSSHDADGVFKVFNDDEVTHFNFRNYLSNVRDARQRIQYWKTCYAQSQRLYWGVFQDDQFIGNIGLVHFDLRGDRLEIGYNLGREYWGHGLMNEALTRILDYLFAEIGVNRVDALVLPGNESSVKVLKNLNFKKDGILRGAAKKRDEGYEDVILYGLVKKDFIHHL